MILARVFDFFSEWETRNDDYDLEYDSETGILDYSDKICNKLTNPIP